MAQDHYWYLLADQENMYEWSAKKQKFESNYPLTPAMQDMNGRCVCMSGAPSAQGA